MIEHKELKLLIDKNKKQYPELNSALIVAASMWGLKSGELSLVTIEDVVSKRGDILKKWVLRAETAFNKHSRKLYTEHESLVDYLDMYLTWRVQEGMGVTNVGEYRTLDPKSKLFLMPGGQPFSFSRREAGNKVNLQPVGMNSYFKKLFQNAGLVDVTYKDFRRSLAIQMYRESKTPGVIKGIMEYLGIRSYSAMRKILSGDKKNIKDMIKGIHKRI